MEVTATGSVRFDNDSLVPDEFVTLVLPDTTLQVVIDPSTGGFTHIFTESSAGSYEQVYSNRGMTPART